MAEKGLKEGEGRAEKNADRDFRLLILLILAAIILAASSAVHLPASWFSWFSPESGQQAATYYYVPAAKGRGEGRRAEVIRLFQPISQTQGRLPTGALAITPDLPCGSVPPEISWLFHLPLPINQADQESLMLLPRIGPVLAQRIIAFREAQGPITGPADFIRVKGIGPKMTARLTPLLCFSSKRNSLPAPLD